MRGGRVMDGTEQRSAMASPPVGDDARQVVDDVESYLVGWMARLQRVLDQCHSIAQREAQLIDRTAAIEQQHQQWQAQRQQEMQQIHQGAEQLSAAWQRLESEQRQWLSARETPQLPPAVAQRSANVPPDPAASNVGVTSGNPGSAPAAAEDRQPPEGMSRESAVRQFEQLRREVGRFGRSQR